MAGNWQRMLLDEAHRESEALIEQGDRAAAEYAEHGNSQTYQDALIALTARVRALPQALAPFVIADLVGLHAWGKTRD